jgi:hypothetical protein
MSSFRTSVEALEQARAEELWSADDLLRRARSSFHLARLRGIGRNFLSLSGPGRPGKRSGYAPRSGAFRIAMAELSGLTGAAKPGRLPILPRRLETAWILAYRRMEDLDDVEAFSLLRTDGRWFLEGGMGELLRLEILRSRGEDSIVAKANPVPALTRVEREAMDYLCPGCEDRRAG